MDWTVRNPREGSITINGGRPPFDTVIETGPRINRLRLLPWLVGVFCIFALIYGSSYLALLWLPPHEEIDMRSQLTADYGPWAFLVFQPVDPAIIEDIRREQNLPEQIIIDGSFWPTSVVETQRPDSNPTAIDMPASTPQPTVADPIPGSSPNASSPMPTNETLLPEPLETLIPIETPIPTKPTKATKPPKPTRLPKPEKPQKPDHNKP